MSVPVSGKSYLPLFPIQSFLLFAWNYQLKACSIIWNEFINYYYLDNWWLHNSVRLEKKGKQFCMFCASARCCKCEKWTMSSGTTLFSHNVWMLFYIYEPFLSCGIDTMASCWFLSNTINRLLQTERRHLEINSFATGLFQIVIASQKPEHLTLKLQISVIPTVTGASASYPYVCKIFNNKYMWN